jgi:hypothetical protein
MPPSPSRFAPLTLTQTPGRSLELVDGRRRDSGHQYLERALSDIRTDTAFGTTEIEMLEAKERWSEYRLADGTVLRLKPVIIAVFRADGQFTADGEQVYNMKSTLITDVRPPATTGTSPVE